MKLSLAMVFAKDMAKMTTFYRDGMGLRLIAERSNEEWSEFDAGGAGFALHRIPEHIARAIVIETPPLPRAETPIKLSFETADVHAAREQLLANGGVMDAVQTEGDRVYFQGLDPEGNVFAVEQRR
jgi:catechol 2,3-dioxygenase-like lactoylglutathione lyase family enzyme